MVGLSYMAKLMGDHVIDRIKRRFDQSAIQHESRTGGHRAPTLFHVAHDQPFRAACIAIRKPSKVHINPLDEFGLKTLVVTRQELESLTSTDELGLMLRKKFGAFIMGLPGF